MAIRSANSIVPPLGNGELSPSRFRSDKAPHPMKSPMSRSGSLSSKIEVQLADGTSSLDPDELFTKYTIAEVKAVQKRLRADAEAKQEELRLMVGERYRDLLQASTSIISIARSSKRVRDVLEDARDSIVAQEQPSTPKRNLAVGNDDAHLQTLQLFSAHMKLLLDAPEHLWRLIERRKFFPAAWLFLLARVVHRALVTDDEQDEGTWSSQGLDVLEQFPLVQRQWDAVSQFRSQIIHKATLSLREYMASVEDTCATLLTLHVLDSRPLTEALSVLVGQRSRTLQSMLSWTSPSSDSVSTNRQANGYPPEKSKAADNQQAIFRRTPVREVKQAVQNSLDVIARTVKTARGIFREDASTHHSLIGDVLEYIQSDSHNSDATTSSLPSELQLTTPNLLMTLPSSTHFLLLPPNLKSYRPYVDLNSSSSFVPQDHLVEKLDEWFRKSTKSLQTAVERWVKELHSVKEVWNVRTSVRRWITSSSGLEDHETLHVKILLDEACRQQVLAIWKLALSSAEKAFQERLESTACTLAQDRDTELTDISPITYLFRAPPLPTVSQGVGSVGVDSSFQKYKSALQRQLLGRTSLLEDVLRILENCARTLQQDLSQIFGTEGDDGRVLYDQLTIAYQPDAEALCYGVINALHSAIEGVVDDTESNINSLIFVGRVADELSSSSPFASSIGCSDDVASDFRRKTRVQYDQTIDRWRKYTVAKCVHEHWQKFRPSSKAFSSTPSEPSTTLVHSLLSLSTSIQQLGLSRDPSRQEVIADQTLHHFITSLLLEPDDETKRWDIYGQQALHDLRFLWKLASLWGVGWSQTSDLVDEKIKRVQKKLLSDGVQSDKAKIDDSSEHLIRTQTLFATLLPHTLAPRSLSMNGDRLSILLPFGTPSLKQQFQAPMELAKPSSRFGLLLIGNAAR